MSSKDEFLHPSDLYDEDVETLEKAGIPVAEVSGMVRSTDEAMELLWHTTDGRKVWQKRLREVPEDGGKYRVPPDTEKFYGEFRERDENTTVVMASEGWKQAMSMKCNTPANIAHYGFTGCYGNVDGPMPFVKGLPFVIGMDADRTKNRDVYDAASKLAKNALANGATSVAYTDLPCTGTDGQDDYLGRQDEKDRQEVALRIIANATTKPGKPPAKKPHKGKPTESDKYFPGGIFDPKALAEDILEEYPCALTRDNTVALYDPDMGIYRIEPLGLLAVITEKCGSNYRVAHRGAVTDKLQGMLYKAGKYLPDLASRPLAVFSNTTVDLTTGQPVGHSPDHMLTTAFPVAWEPEATCPVYDELMMEAAGDQLDALEESVSQLLDSSRSPHFATMLFGESHSGKGTFIHIISAVAGRQNCSAVPLAALENNRFAAAKLYGKALNAVAELPAAHLSEISVFKKMTGGDEIFGEHKGGHPFTFYSRAVMLFSANQVPSVKESSRAYFNRMAPFRFDKSFSGKEDGSMERKIIAEELSGVVQRLAKAYRKALHNNFRKPVGRADVAKEFEIRTDQVTQCLSDCCVVHELTGSTLPDDLGTPPRSLYRDVYIGWCAREGIKLPLRESQFIDKAAKVDGVVRCRTDKGVRVFNVTVKNREDWGSGLDDWPDVDPDPEPDPDPDSGHDCAGNPGHDCAGDPDTRVPEAESGTGHGYSNPPDPADSGTNQSATGTPPADSRHNQPGDNRRSDHISGTSGTFRDLFGTRESVSEGVEGSDLLTHASCVEIGLQKCRKCSGQAGGSGSHADSDQQRADYISSRMGPVLAQFASRGVEPFNPYDSFSYVDGFLLAADHLDVPDEMADVVIEALCAIGWTEWTGCLDDGSCDGLRLTPAGLRVARRLTTPAVWTLRRFIAMATAA